MPSLLWFSVAPVLTAIPWIATGAYRLKLSDYLQAEAANCQLTSPVPGCQRPQGGHRPQDPATWCSEQVLVGKHLLTHSSKGSDVRLDAGALFNPRAGQHASVNTKLWLWRQAFNWKWKLGPALAAAPGTAGSQKKPSKHINVLELRALLTATKWHLRSYKSIGSSTLRITDSRVVQGITTKYRSSAKQLHRLVRRLGALELAASARISTGFTRSDWNVADEGSRVSSKQQ